MVDFWENSTGFVTRDISELVNSFRFNLDALKPQENHEKQEAHTPVSGAEKTSQDLGLPKTQLTFTQISGTVATWMILRIFFLFLLNHMRSGGSGNNAFVVDSHIMDPLFCWAGYRF